MQQVYTQQHLTQAHHSGLVSGTLVGSLFVSVFIAVLAVASSPRLVLHPLSLVSELSTSKQQASPAPQSGIGATTVNSQTDSRGSNGTGLNAVTGFSNR